MSRLHVGDQVLDHRHVSHRLDDDLGAAVALGLVATHLRGDGVALGIGLRLAIVLQASVDWPLIFTPQEPQIAARQEQRTAREPSSRSLA